MNAKILKTIGRHGLSGLTTKVVTTAVLTLGLLTTTHAGVTISQGNASLSWSNNHSNASSEQAARQIMYGSGGAYFNNNTLTERGYASQSWYRDGSAAASLDNYLHAGSRGVLVMDLSNDKVLYDKNADIARPIASISKLMTAMVVLDAKQDIAEEITITDFDFIAPKKSGSDRLKVGDTLNRAQLLLMMLMKSENPAAKALARSYPGGYHAFMQAMNQKAQSLGMYSTHFGDPSGLDPNNVASPRDLAKMLQAASNYNVIRSFTTQKHYNFDLANQYSGYRMLPARNTSYLIRDGLYDIGISKTGFIREAGKCVVMLTQINNRPAAVVILGANSSKTRWEDAENILTWLANRRIT